MQTGKRPVGTVMGSCVYHVAHHGMMQSIKQTGRNVELEQYTHALYDARELAMERMQKEAKDLGNGVLGIVEVKLRENNHGWGGHVIGFFRRRNRGSPQRARSRGAPAARHHPGARHQRLMCRALCPSRGSCATQPAADTAKVIPEPIR
jgi:uncharacterized protein YbjQ (UPF0145 family)